MGQLILGTIGSVAGQALLPNGLSLFGAQLTGGAIGGFAGSALGASFDRALLSQRTIEGPRLDNLQIQTSTEGAAIPIVYGRGRLAGQVIWASRFREHHDAEGGGKGGPRVSRYSYSVSLAVGICEGDISGIGRIWANGELLDQSALSFRLYRGTEDQSPDPLIVAVEGAADAPAFRGLSYVVFEDLPLEAFGNRVPQFAFEVFRSPWGIDGEAGLENAIRAVDLIPASGEFAYATTPVLEDVGPGRQNWINLNNGRGQPDFMAAIDDLEAQLPNCRSVLVVSAWFGTDLRCDACDIRPGVETRERITRPLIWSVAGEDRTTAHLVSTIDDRPAYGGTPDDASLIAAIQELKARGFNVSLYPFILMDVAAGNALPDPYGEAEQAVYPWRGRITCFPAPGEPGSPDQTSAAVAAVEAFFGTAAAADFSVSNGQVSYSGPPEWRFRRFILHHAALAQAAGGVDGFLIGSEMRGLTTIRGASDSFPAVTRLCDLAGEARQLLGSGTRISYASDWSEYFGFQPSDGSGDVFFHLDPLWSHSTVDAVAIDWYAPLSDWREGEHLDASLASGPHDLAYLSANVEGGEGYDWYYALDADRDAQLRTPITDGAHGKPWVFRYKDLSQWWREPHFDRKAGVELGAPTGWVPESKPIWLTELGCPAVDKGANQPNVFVDPKSAESRLPYHSTGARDDLIQRRYIEALIGYWSMPDRPVSTVYGGPMIDPADIHIWTWDARPFPDFPVRRDVWSDGENWRLGHWLNGRTGLSPLALIVREIGLRAGTNINVNDLRGLVSGFVIDRPMPARRAIEPLTAAYGFALADRADGVVAISDSAFTPTPVQEVELALPETGRAISTRRPETALLPRDVRLQFRLDAPDYRVSTVYARHATNDLQAVFDVTLPLLADEAQARVWSALLLDRAIADSEAVQFSLPPSKLSLESGDSIRLNDRNLTVRSATGQAVREVETGPVAGAGPSRFGATPQIAGPVVRPYPQPLLLILDIPLVPSETAERSGVLLAANADPWPRQVTLHAGASKTDLTPRISIDSPSRTGRVVAAHGRLWDGRWNRSAELTVQLDRGELVTRSPSEVLAGGNRMALAIASGWSWFEFETADLVAPQTYRLRSLLAASDIDLDALANAPVVVLDDSLASLSLPPGKRDLPIAYAALALGLQPDPALHDVAWHTYRGADMAPLPVAHLKADRRAEGFRLHWIRRTRLGGDDWVSRDVPLAEEGERYAISLVYQGAIVHADETSLPEFLLDSDLIASAIGPSPVAFEVRVQQISARYGAGAAAEIGLAA
jgi:hypothetical protein